MRTLIFISLFLFFISEITSQSTEINRSLRIEVGASILSDGGVLNPNTLNSIFNHGFYLNLSRQVSFNNSIQFSVRLINNKLIANSNIPLNERLELDFKNQVSFTNFYFGLRGVRKVKNNYLTLGVYVTSNTKLFQFNDYYGSIDNEIKLIQSVYFTAKKNIIPFVTLGYKLQFFKIENVHFFLEPEFFINPFRNEVLLVNIDDVIDNTQASHNFYNDNLSLSLTALF